MPAKRRTSRRSPRRSKDDLKPRLLTAAMELAAAKGWRQVTLKALASRLRVSEMMVRKLFPRPVDVLLALVAEADAAMVAPEGSVRDQLFELTLQRFEALAPYREGLAALANERGAWLALAPELLPVLLRSSRFMLQQAGAGGEGPLAGLRALVWLGIKADVARAWFEDDSADLAKTMAALDRRLAQLEKAVAVLGPLAGEKC